MRQDLEAVRNCQAEHAQRTYNAVELPGKTIGPDFYAVLKLISVFGENRAKYLPCLL